MKKPTGQLNGGKRVASTTPGDEVVISGMSGNFPNSNNITEYTDNLKKKLNLCDESERRFDHTNSEIPRNSGKVYNLENFDSGFFGVHSKQANKADPMIRRLLEITHEALLDAGMALEDLAGTKTGVYVGVCWLEMQKYIFDNLEKGSAGILWCSKSMLAHSISYSLKLNGPSTTCDTACSSGMYALEEAYRSMKEGKCEAAIVTGVNLLLNPSTTIQFARLGVLNINKECRPFDDGVTGYTRSESIVTIILQKAKNAKRIYAQIVHAKTNDDGFKAEGITFPSTVVQKALLEDVYEECGVSVADIGFVEAHGTGTIVGDVVELDAIDSFFCSEKRGGKPLIIGSVKGNIGHAEAASGLNSIIKVAHGMANNCIYPNIHYDTPRKESGGLTSGRLRVATELLAWPENAPYAGVNSFGFGGANCHVLLKKYENTAINKPENIPQLICLSGRTEESITHFHDFLKQNKINHDFIRIVREAYKKKIRNNYYRGYAVLSDNGEMNNSVKYMAEEPKPLYLCIGSRNKLNISTLNELQKLPIFQERLEHYMAVMSNNEIKIDFNPKETDMISQIMSTLSIQLGIIDLIKILNITPDFIFGTSFGNFVAAYANKALTITQTIIATHKVTELFLQSSRSKSNKNLHTDLLNLLKSILPNDSCNVNRHIISKSNPFNYASPEYFVYNIMNPNELPTIEDGVILSIDFESKDNTDIIELVTPNMKLEDFLKSIGSLYEYGYEIEISSLYPKVHWPIRVDTPPYSPLVKWDHSKKCFVVRFGITSDKPKSGQSIIEYNLKQNSNTYLKGHVIDGRNLFPATGYLICIAEWYANICKNNSFDQQKLIFENVKFHKATTFGKNEAVSFNLLITKTGFFEISENDVSIVTGHLSRAEAKINKLPEYEESETKLLQKDIYKELRLRGYNYSGLFCGIKELCGNRGMIEWSNNFVSFLDNMLQLYILQEDSRGLYVPTGINKMILNFPGHLEYVRKYKDTKCVPVFIDNKTQTLMTESIAIIGIQASSIPRRKQLLDPILEVYKFIPNEGVLTLEEALRVNAQIILENSKETSFKILEYIYEERQPVGPIFQKAMEDHPVIQPITKIISNLNIDFGEIEIVKETIESQNGNGIFIGSNLLSNETVLKSALKTLISEGYIITLESRNSVIPKNLISITKYEVPNYTIHLLSTKKYSNVSTNAFNVSSGLNWIKPLQNHLRTIPQAILYAEDEPNNGILGLTNCLRREIKDGNITAFFVQGAPKFDIKHEFYQNQLKKCLSVNVFQNGQWGTYRHLLLSQAPLVETEHCFGNATQTGDLNSLKWISGPMQSNFRKSENTIVVYNSAINFRDLMTSSGKVGIHAITKDRMEQECIMGLEYSGRNLKGERLMGVVSSGGIATLVNPDLSMMWKVPDNWTLEEAVTVPVVYYTVLLALKIRTNIKKGQSILIHSGTGGIGLSAINVALHFGLTVFTTVGTEEKREYLKKMYPQIKASHIGNSRDTSFEQMIFKETNGQGVDYVLNSLAEEKLLASVRCLALNGNFLEIGKFDISKDAELGIQFQAKGASFHGVMLDKLFGKDKHNNIKRQLGALLQEGIEKGYVRPLPTTVFKMEQIQEAFRYMGTGKHIGKILIKLREEEKMKIVKPMATKFFALPRSYFEPSASYVILGGLGGFGLELTDWMVLRGARNLVLSSRNGIKNGYQKYVINKLILMGAKIVISQEDIKTNSGCLNIIKTANSMGPVQGIFNLAVELKDGAFDNLSENDFEISIGPKATASNYLDAISKTHCPQLKHFVLFSSVSCGRGNAGQTNYGMSNSIMERLCERRRSEGLPALAIQWGAIGDVGLVAEMQKEQNEIIIGGTLQQRISSCLEVMDMFLQSDAIIVASMVVAEKSVKNNSDNIVDAVMNILGIRDLKTIGPHTTLPELGMDSMMAVEIKQTLERDFDVFLTPQDIKCLSVNTLMEMNNDKDSVISKPQTQPGPLDSFNVFFGSLYHENTYNLHKVDCVKDVHDEKIFYFPGIEGVATSIETLIQSTSENATCFQYTANGSFKELSHLYDDMWRDLKTCKNGFKFVAHSLGTVFALEMAAKLESEGKLGEIILIDGSPDFAVKLAKIFPTSEIEFEISIISVIISKFLEKETLSHFQDKLLSASNYQERLNIALDYIPENIRFNKTMLATMGDYMYNVIKALANYTPSYRTKIKSKITLFKAEEPTIKDIAEDFGLSKYCENLVEIKYFAGNHKTVTENEELFEDVNQIFL